MQPLGRSKAIWHVSDMATLTIALSDSLAAALMERAKDSGAGSKEEYLIALVEADCGAHELDRVLAGRTKGPFAPLEQERASARVGGKPRE
jgi:hypothetical protein